MSASPHDAAHWRRCYRRAAWAGVLVSSLVGLALVIVPETLLPVLRADGEPRTWPQFAGVLLCIAGVFGVPAALDAERYRTYAWLGAVPVRLAGFIACALAVLASGAPAGLLVLTLPDAIVGALQAWILARLSRAEVGPAPAAGVDAASPWAGTSGVGVSSDGSGPWRGAFRWITWGGIALNAAFFVPLILVPELFLRVLGVGGAPLVWPQLFGVLLAMLSLLYVPTAVDPDRYRLLAWLSVVPSRLAGVVFCVISVVVMGAGDAFLLGALLDFGVGAAQLFALSGLARAELRGRACRRPLVRRFGPDLAALVAGLAVLGSVGWHKLGREYPQSSLGTGDMEEMFKYGSVGTEDAAGLPYWIWISLPGVFPEYLPGPGGYPSLGILWEEGAELPVGFARKRIGYERIGLNCALCHAGSVQVPGEPVPRIHLGAPAGTVDVLAYQRFLFACANDPRFDASTLMAAIERQTRLSWIDALLYRYALIPLTRSALQEQSRLWAWTREAGRPPWGRGRIEPFNPVKVSILQHVDPEVTVGSTLGTSDTQPLWRLGSIPGRALHWDGMNANLTEVVNSSALGDGATPESIPRDYLGKLEEWIKSNEPPAYPFDPPDETLVSRGAEVFRSECARCHAPDGERTGRTMAVGGADGVGTDENRALMWTKAAADAYNAYIDEGWKFEGFQSTGEYLCVPLDGLWLRAPYLHNGSVPTLADLLEVPAARPALFWRGSNEYDPVRVGFVSRGPAVEAVGTLYDTSGRGNGNQGHLYGTTLPDADKRALLEYLKTL